MQLRFYPANILLFLTAMLASQVASASNGYFPHGVGAKNKAMAGAGMALPEDAMAVVNNPAVAVFLGNKIDIGMSVFMPNRNYRTFFGGNFGRNNTFSISPANIDSDDELFIIPEIARNWQLTTDTAFAIAFYMRSGMSTSYQGGQATFDPDGDGPLGITTLPGTYGDGTAGLDLSQGYLDVTWAKRWGKRTSLGVTAVLAVQSLEVKGMGGLAKYTQTFAASNGALMPDKLSGNGRDVNYGAGLKIGLHRLLGNHFSVGIMYQSKINMGSNNTYADLFAGGGDLDIPAWFRLGLTWEPGDRFSLSADLQQIWYSKIDALGNSFNYINACPATGLGGADLSSCLGGDNGPGFGWKDVPVFSFGTSWEVTDRWTARAGISISNQPVPAAENILNILLISLAETHYTAGLGYQLGNGHELSFSFMYAEEESLESRNQLDGSEVILLTTDQFDFGLSYSWEF